MTKSGKREADHAQSDASKMTPKRIVRAGLGTLGFAGSGYAIYKGYEPGWVFYGGTAAISASVIATAFNVQRGMGNVGAERVKSTRRGSFAVAGFGAFLLLIGVNDTLRGRNDLKAPFGTPTTITAEPAITAPVQDAAAEPGARCWVVAPIPDGELTDEQESQVKQLQAYMSGLVLPNGEQLPPIDPNDNNFKSEDSQLAKNVTALQKAYGLEPTDPWNEEACKETDLYHA